MGWAAMVMAEKLLVSFEGKSVLIIGAGEMSAVAVNQIHKKGIKNLYLMNRTEETARELTDRYQGIPVSFCDIKVSVLINPKSVITTNLT